MTELQTALESTVERATPASLPLVLVAAADAGARERRLRQLRARGFRVTLARTGFEAIVKACCQLPDLIMLDTSLDMAGDCDAPGLLATCPATAHIPVVQLRTSGRLPTRMLANLRRAMA